VEYCPLGGRIAEYVQGLSTATQFSNNESEAESEEEEVN